MKATSLNLFKVIEIHGSRKLGIFTGKNSKVFAQTDLVALKRDKGWYQTADGTLKEWKIEGSTEIEDKVVFYGPLLAAQEIPEDFNPSEKEFNELKHFFCSLDNHRENRFSSLHFARLEEGGFLQFPPHLMHEIEKINYDRGDYSLRKYSHPDLSGDKQLSYALACIQFRMIFGHDPWVEQEEEAMDHEIRERVLPPFERFLKPESSALFLWNVLQMGEEGPDLEEWRNYETIHSKEVSPEFLDALEKSYKRFYQKRYVMRHRIKLMAIGTSAALGLYIMIRIILNILAPAYTEGMEPTEVVNLFYQAWGDLDVTVTSELIVKRSKIDTQYSLDFMYVSTRIRQGTDRSSRVILPEQWLEAGKPALGQFDMIFGLTDLKLEQIESNHFKASYLAWFPSGADDDLTVPTVVQMEDEILLTTKKDSWFIEEIRTLNKESVDIDQL